MNWSMFVHTTLSSDTEPTVIVTFESGRYIFNVGENTTRAWLQSRRGWRKVKGVFLTQVSTQRASGLPGVLMSLADSAPRHVDIAGPSGLMHYLASMRLYVFRNSLSINAIELPSTMVPAITEPAPAFKDGNLTIYSIPITKQKPPVNPEPSTSSSLKRSRSRSRSPADRPSKRPAPATTGSPTHTTIDLSTGTDSVPLLDRLLDPAFSPTDLVGADAQEWRRRTVEHMFTWVAPPEPPAESRLRGKGAKKKGKAAAAAAAAAEDSSASAMPQIPHWVEGDATTAGGAKTTSANSEAAPVPYTRRNRKNPAGSFKLLPAHSPPAHARGATQAYVVVGPRMRGKFDVKRAEALGLTGRLRGRVASGETVRYMVDDGCGGQVERVVRHEDCVGESESPTVVVVLDIPTPEHVDSLVKAFESGFHASFRSKTEEDRKKYNVHVIYHILGEGVLEDPRYQDFMAGFADQTHHLISSRDYGPDKITFTSAAFSQLRLNRLDPAAFPLPFYNTTPKKDLSSIPSLPPNAAILSPNTYINLRPPKAPVPEQDIIDRDRFHPAVAAPGEMSLPAETQSSFKWARRTVARREQMMRESEGESGGMEVQSPGDDVVVVPLGTSSAVTTRYRNVSSLLVQIPGHGNVLLDAGEGTWGQLARYFGTDRARAGNVWDVLREMKCIYISHAHADHHVGLAKVLSMRRKLDPPPSAPLFLVSIPSVHIYLREYAQLEDLGLADNPSSENGVVAVDSEAICVAGSFSGGRSRDYPVNPWDDPVLSTVGRDLACDALGLQNLETVHVRHRTRAYGIVLTHRDGWRLVYSGDTMPTHHLAQAGRGATLLIHEATMGDDQAEMAKLKAHSTVGQAIDIGKQMNAQNILLTHFSTRYPHMPARYFRPPSPSRSPKRSPSPAPVPTSEEPVVAMALDHARIRVGDMWKLQAYMPAIERSFIDSKEEGDDEEEEMLLASAVAHTHEAE
ncbi:hypothetical protein DENSPDRAFT_930713 [Dentipellis sp. KUC8613]|nr:hypothetical protein DENSPDRAFT_930713 [Dentipellis sp. KUC8613]